LPFPELSTGIKQVADHNEAGHLSYFMGELRTNGWWAFFPVLIAIKLPIGVLVLAAIGLWRRPKPAPPRGHSRFWCDTRRDPRRGVAVEHQHRHSAHSGAVPFSRRHRGVGILWLARQSEHKSWAPWTAAVAALAVWLVTCRPSGLFGLFQRVRGSEPERIVVDSDLDWGRTSSARQRLRELKASSVAFTAVFPVNPWYSVSTVPADRGRRSVSRLERRADHLVELFGWVCGWKNRKRSYGRTP